MKTLRRLTAYNSQGGSSTLALIASIAAVGLASVFVYSSSQKQKIALNAEKQRRIVEGQNSGLVNSAARFRAMVAGSKQSGSVHIPALFAINYYHADWKLTQNPDIKLSGTTLQGAGEAVDINVAANFNPSTADLQKIFNGSQSLSSLQSDSSRIKILDTNLDETKRIVKSIDVEITLDSKGKGTKSKARYRVPVPSPTPYGPVLEISPANAEAWTRDFSKKFPPGKYDLRVLASGVVYDAEVFMEGARVAKLGGFDTKTGKITHEAVQALAKDKEIGRFPYTFEDKGGSGDPTTCLFNNAIGTYTFSVEVRGPDSQEIAKIESQVVEIQESPETPVDIAELSMACNDKCAYLGALDGSGHWEALDPRLATGNFGDFSGFNLMVNQRRIWGLGNRKACLNPTKAGNTYYGAKGYFPPNFGELDQTLLEAYAYSPFDCKPQFVFKRNSCGCFKDDTRILLGDGKTEKAISDLSEDDLVWSPVRRKAFPLRRLTRGPEKVPMLAIRAGGQLVEVTGHHPFPARDGFKPAHALEVGERIKLGDDRWVAIEEIQAIPQGESGDPIVWNLELDVSDDDLEAHQVVANGLITGDLLIQSLLQTQK